MRRLGAARLKINLAIIDNALFLLRSRDRKQREAGVVFAAMAAANLAGGKGGKR